MTVENDQYMNPDRLSPNSKRMHALRDVVLSEWGKRLRETVKEAASLPHPILINTFPSLYDNLAQAITPDYPRSSSDEGNTVASEHGGERARLTNYNAQAVISEYQLLRWTIFDVLRLNGVQLDNHEFYVINASIDESIRESVSSFALAQSALRERFVASLTHDLRNPLASASMAAQLIRQKVDSPEVKALAERINRDLDRMDGMIRELLDAAVFQTGERLRLNVEQFDMLDVAREVHEEFTVIYGAHFHLLGKSVIGYWDRSTVKRALENLVGNAVKYSAPATPIRIKLESEHERMILAVHNEGEPIPVEQLECVFQVFRRAVAAKEGNTQGWGIGLPFVRAVAESHGGSVGVDSTANRGTTFMIDIPLDARPYQMTPTLGETA